MYLCYNLITANKEVISTKTRTNKLINMDSKIQELTDKVYQEGVIKGNAEAERIISEAKVQADELVAKATKRAEEILSSSKRQSEENIQNTQRELQLYAAQLVEATRASLTNELTGRIASENVGALSTNPEFIQKFMLELVKGFDLNKGVEITGANAAQLEQYFAGNARELLERGVAIKNVAGKSTDFTISPKDGGFKLQIGEAEFLELFKSFLRPQLSEQLF